MDHVRLFSTLSGGGLGPARGALPDDDADALLLPFAFAVLRRGSARDKPGVASSRSLGSPRGGVRHARTSGDGAWGTQRAAADHAHDVPLGGRDLERLVDVRRWPQPRQALDAPLAMLCSAHER